VHKQWMGCEAKNFQPGRAGFRPEAIVVHRTGGSLKDIDKRYSQAGTFSSSHYAVGADATIHQYVEEGDTAFHAGVVVNPDWTRIKPSRNPNFYTIGIEFEGNPGEPISGTQYDAAAGLIAEIGARWAMEVDADHVILHRQIRAGRDCPGDGFDRQELLDRIQTLCVQPEQTPESEQEVRILRDSNVHEGAPSTTARIVRVAAGSTAETVCGFTDQGERLQGNSYWYRTQDGNYFWAGGTDTPNPVRPSPPRLVPLPHSTVPSTSVACGIPRIDQLMAGDAAPALTDEENDRLAIGAVQDLLTGLGISGLPTVLSSSYGVYGPKTAAAVGSFRQQHGLEGAPGVDSLTLQKMVATPPSDPKSSTAYLALALGFPPTGMHKILSLVSQMEGAGKFAALNRNTDRAGLSFGLIQWAQKPGRLAEILSAMLAADLRQFAVVFGGGDGQVANALIAHCQKPSGGVDPKTGEAINPSFDLIVEPWVSRFRQAALIARFQQVQVQMALAAFERSYEALRRFAPELQSERSVAFMLDLANQFGDGGAQQVYVAASRAGMSEMEVLEAVADASVERMADPLKAGVRARRDHFLNISLLSAEPFPVGEAALAANLGR
jgi:N-acetyl-anhydromuramyl-L-alanine amidase AmpD/peptidoglycan hydrolase-like protein with peptidoglycan-binding domain